MAVGRRKGLAVAVLAGLSALLPASSALGAPSGSFSPTGQMGVARQGPAVAPLSDGRVLVAGGFDGADIVATAETFDPATGAFTPVPNAMTTAREGAGAVLLGDGRVLIAGGYNPLSPSTWLKSAEVFDPATNSFTPVGDMSVARSLPAAAPLPGGGALLIGGFDGNTVPQRKATAEVFNPATNTFSAAGIGSMSTGRAGAVAAPLADGRILVAGGSAGGPSLRSAEIFSPGTGSFTATGSLETPRDTAAAAPLPDGRVLVVGGYDNDALMSAESFDPATGGSSSAGIGSLGVLRNQPGAAPLQDGRVLVVGGASGAVSPVVKSAELFTLSPTSLSFRVRGKRLLVELPVAGTISVAGSAKKKAAISKKGKARRRLLKPVSATGGPGTVSLRLRPLGNAKQKLRQKGKVRIRVALSFVPSSGSCVASFKHCYYEISQQAKLKLKRKKRK